MNIVPFVALWKTPTTVARANVDAYSSIHDLLGQSRSYVRKVK